MTASVCLNCGKMKIGATLPCPECGHAAGGDEQLNLLLSDWFCDLNELEAIGHMVKEISKHCDARKMRHWALMLYLIREHPRILSGSVPDDVANETEAVLSKCTKPPVSREQDSIPRAGDKNQIESIDWDDDLP